MANNNFFFSYWTNIFIDKSNYKSSQIYIRNDKLDIDMKTYFSCLAVSIRNCQALAVNGNIGHIFDFNNRLWELFNKQSIFYITYFISTLDILLQSCCFYSFFLRKIPWEVFLKIVYFINSNAKKCSIRVMKCVTRSSSA